jgi:hypothetical protein
MVGGYGVRRIEESQSWIVRSVVIDRQMLRLRLGEFCNMDPNTGLLIDISFLPRLQHRVILASC